MLSDLRKIKAMTKANLTWLH